MTSYDWKNAVNGAWTDGSKWTPTGGPTLDEGGGTYSSDTAVFDTGSSRSYGISGVADARIIEVEHDHVAFNDLQASNDAMGLDLDASAGALVIIAPSSVVNLLGDFYSADDGQLNVSDAKVKVEGTLENGFGYVGAGGLLAVAGGKATFINEHDIVGGGAVAAGGTISVTQGGTLDFTPLEMDGTIVLAGQGSVWNSAGIFYEPEVTGGTVIGENGATLAGYVTNDGMIEAKSGVFHVSTTVANYIAYPEVPGVMKIDGGATLDLSGSSQNTIDFLPHATLDLGSGLAATGLLTSFSTGDKVDLLKQTLNSFSAVQSGGDTTLTGYNGSTEVALLKLAGSYALTDFSLRSDGNGGTLIDYAAPHSQHAFPVNLHS